MLTLIIITQKCEVAQSEFSANPVKRGYQKQNPPKILKTAPIDST